MKSLLITLKNEPEQVFIINCGFPYGYTFKQIDKNTLEELIGILTNGNFKFCWHNYFCVITDLNESCEDDFGALLNTEYIISIKSDWES